MSVRRHAGATDTGRKRRRNEDAYVVQPPLFAVADGMGGPQAGEVASRLAAAALEESSIGGSGGEQVTGLIQEANRRVHAAASEQAAHAGMGTTMTVAVVEDGAVAIGHVGDSRAYRLRDHKLEQLTEDHSLVAELMRSGKLSPEEARIHPQRSVITRALGTDPDVDVDTYTVETQPGDVFLLCSDGLFSMVEDKEIENTLYRNRSDLDSAVKALIKQALKGGGEDNITVVCFEIGEPLESPPASDLERTREHVLASDDADTLDELDGVPTLAEHTGVGDTVMVSADELRAAVAAEAAPAPEPEPEPEPEPARSREQRERRGFFAPALLLLLVAVIVLLVVWGLTR
jgi:serine/threonine protein phosphatase PrpC